MFFVYPLGRSRRAAKTQQHKAIGIEIDERYCELAATRLEQEVFDCQSLQSSIDNLQSPMEQ